MKFPIYKSAISNPPLYDPRPPLRPDAARVAVGAVHLGDVADIDRVLELDALGAAGCDFWVLELHTVPALEQTRKIVEEYLASREGVRNP